LGVEVLPGLLYVGIRQFYALLSAEYDIKYVYDGGSGTQVGEANNHINGQAFGASLGLFDTLYFGGTYLKSYKQYDSKNTYTDTTPYTDTAIDTTKVKVIQYAYGATLKLGGDKGARTRIELYRLTQEKRSVFEDIASLKDGTLDKAAIEVVLGGLLMGANVLRYRGDYLNIYRLSDYYFFYLTPTNEYVYKYGANLGFEPSKGFSFGVSALLTTGKQTQSIPIDNYEDGELVSTTIQKEEKKVETFSVGVNMSYVF
jgi:hypothetical protein